MVAMVSRFGRSLRLSAATLMASLGWASGTSSCGGRTDLPIELNDDEEPRNCCVLGFTECDQRSENGCETWTQGDDLNCGGCGNVCPAGTFCAQGTCEDPQKVVEIVAAEYSTCVRRAGGEVLCWGNNEQGALGDLAAPSSSLPRSVTGIIDATSLRGTGQRYCVTRREGGPLCWGAGREIHEIPPIENLAVLSPLNDSTCALMTTGALWCWGANDGGQLGDGTFQDSDVPVAALNLDDAVQIEGTCALRCDGTVWCWSLKGLDEPFLPSYQNTGKPELLPIKEKCGPGQCEVRFQRIARSSALLGGIDTNGRAHFWSPIMESREAEDIELVRDLGAAWAYSVCFLTAASDLICWSEFETDIQFGRGEQIFELSDVFAFSAGWTHSCAVSHNGAVSCWGENESGQLGNGTTEDSDLPVEAKLD